TTSITSIVSDHVDRQFEATMSVLTTLAMPPWPSVMDTVLLAAATVKLAPLTVWTDPDVTSLHHGLGQHVVGEDGRQLGLVLRLEEG
ncbi:MAG: hypothetical protein ACHQNA_07215, partial [Acidimicrobiales bacterium]